MSSSTETDLLDALGMAIALANFELVTTPAGGAAAAVARGYRATSGRPASLRNKPIEDPDTNVVVYPDERMFAALYAREPSPITHRWIVLLTPADLESFVAATLHVIEGEGKSIA